MKPGEWGSPWAHCAAWRIGVVLGLGELQGLGCSHMLHGAGIFTKSWPINDPDVGNYSINGASGMYMCIYIYTYDLCRDV